MISFNNFRFDPSRWLEDASKFIHNALSYERINQEDSMNDYMELDLKKINRQGWEEVSFEEAESMLKNAPLGNQNEKSVIVVYVDYCGDKKAKLLEIYNPGGLQVAYGLSVKDGATSFTIYHISDQQLNDGK